SSRSLRGRGTCASSLSAVRHGTRCTARCRRTSRRWRTPACSPVGRLASSTNGRAAPRRRCLRSWCSTPRWSCPHSEWYWCATTPTADAWCWPPTVTTDPDARVQRWLGWAMVAVLLAVAIGGITRLTQSGLSITVWEPVRGVIPPLTTEAWQEAYARYLLIPEARGVHRGITLPEFQVLFWW